MSRTRVGKTNLYDLHEHSKNHPGFNKVLYEIYLHFDYPKLEELCESHNSQICSDPRFLDLYIDNHYPKVDDEVASLDEKLVYAVYHGHYILVQHLIASGADVNNNDGAPLKYAIENGDIDVVSVLLKAGASVHIEEAMKPLVRAVAENQPEIVKLLLLAGAEISDLSGYGTLIEKIIQDNNVEMMSILLLAGLNVTDVDINQAKQYGRDEIVDLLEIAKLKQH